jgi:predicted HTH transcriptional regulator
MILPKHPDVMSDEDLGDWVLRLVSRKTPESIFLDYKKTVTTDSRSDKCEIAKDASSFANERGGILLYGIPQVEEGDEPVPVGYEEIGMDRIPGLCQKVEDILVGTLTPKLPELRVREIPLIGLSVKVVYLVWHPQSWEAPHMISAYKEHRYYRRGNFRAVLMEEAEVERLYLRRQARRMLATEFLQEADFGGSLPAQYTGPALQIVICPAY